MKIPILSNLLGIGKTIAERVVRKKADEETQLNYALSEGASVRNMQSNIQEIPIAIIAAIVSSLRHGIRIFGGYFSQGVIFFNIIIGNSGKLQALGYERITYSPLEGQILILIITYFYGSRLIEIATGRRK